MHTRQLIAAALLMALSMGGQAMDAARLDSWVESAPRPALRTEYHPQCPRPLEYVGYSFAGPREELLAMRANGANIVGTGSMWIPVRDPDAPDGCGYELPLGHGRLAQTFRATQRFDAVAPCLPTGNTADSGCAWRLYRASEGRPAGEPLAEGVWPLVADNSWPTAEFPAQPPGDYALEIHSPTGSWIGWWGREGDPYPAGVAIGGDGRPDPDIDLQLRLRPAGGAWIDVVADLEPHRAFKLGPSDLDVIHQLGLVTQAACGNWNNPGFNYYPEWFMERFPGAWTVDQYGEPVMGGSMMERSIPSPSIEHPVIVEGTQRYIRAMVGAYREAPAVLYWVIGGEALYATYGLWDRWFDYSERARMHYRRWLGEQFGDLGGINRALGTSFTDWAAVEPPRQPEPTRAWFQWMNFRFASMGERMGWHWQAMKSADTRRFAMSCNHGTLFENLSYAAMGARFDQFAAQTDGFETGQIISDSDPTCYNLLYTESIVGLGKPYCPARLAYKKTDPDARGGGTSYTPEAVRRYGYETLGAGAWHLGFIQWSGSLPDGEWGVVGTPAEQAIARFQREVRAMAPVLEDLNAVTPAVGVFLDHYVWTMEGWLPAWQALHERAIERQIPKHYVHDLQVRGGLIDDYAMLVCIDHAWNDPLIVGRLAAYLADGGRLLVAGRGADALPEALATHEGRIARLATTDADAVLDAVEAELGAAARPVRVASDEMVRRLTDEEIVTQHDRPADLAAYRSVGQSITCAYGGLTTISLSMPTYTRVPPVGFTFTVREDGPEGRVIAQREVGAEIRDNAWVPIRIDEAVPAGGRLYIEARAGADLPEQHLGWWTNSGDLYAGGTAYEDGRTTAGDRRVKLVYHRPLPGRRAIESFVLSDGLNYGVVLINIGDDPLALRVDADPLLPSDRGADYRASALLRPGDWRGEGARGELTLPAHDAEVLYFERAGGEAMAADLLRAAGRAATSWQRAGALTPYAEYALTKARGHQREGRHAKAAAGALGVCRQLGLETRLTEDATLTATVLDAEGRPVTDARVWVEITPSNGVLHDLTHLGRGRYALALTPERLPRLYDYRTQRYGDFSGPARLRVAARAGARSASRLIDEEF